MAGTDLFTHIKYMTLTTVPTIAITLLVFIIIGFSLDTTGVADVSQYQEAIDATFNTSPILFVVPIVVIAMIIKKVSPLIALLIGTLLAGLFALIFQPELVHAISGVKEWNATAMYKGVMNAITIKTVVVPVTDNPEIADKLSGLFEGKGMESMLGTIWLWMPALARLKFPVQTLPLMAIAVWLLWPAAGHVLPEQPLDSFLELPRLMVVAGYSVFKLSAPMLIGIAVGLWVAREDDTRLVRSRLMATGFAGMAFCATTVLWFEGPESIMTRGLPVFVSPPGYAFYASFMIALLGLSLYLTGAWSKLSRPTLLALRMLIVIGGLALPIYVFHGLVIPIMHILILIGMDNVPALILPLGVFLVSMAYAGQWLYRMYFR
jgi:hypothetical protein